MGDGAREFARNGDAGLWDFVAPPPFSLSLPPLIVSGVCIPSSSREQWIRGWCRRNRKE